MPSRQGEGDTTFLEPKPRRTTFNSRKRRPVPTTRAEADELYGVGRVTGPASGAQLYRLARRGLLRIVELEDAGEPITRGQAHQALLDALYDPVTGLLRDMPTEPVQAERVHETTD